MRDLELFSQALGLQEPWRVVETRFDAERRRLDLWLDFKRGARFCCPECEREGCEVHDTSEKTWRHLNFFQHEAYLTARVPRVRCPEHGVHQVKVAWAREGSGFRRGPHPSVSARLISVEYVDVAWKRDGGQSPASHRLAR